MFEIALGVTGRHGVSGGPAGNGVWFGALPAAELPTTILSRVGTAIASTVVIGDTTATGVITYTDKSSAASDDVQSDIEWPSGALPTADEVWVVVPAGKQISGLQLWLNAPGNFAHSGLSWVVDYRTSAGNVSVTIGATATAPGQLASAAAGTLLSVMFDATLNTDSIPSLPIPGRTDFGRAIRLRVSGTITAGTTWPKFGRIWPLFDYGVDGLGYTDYASIVQPMISPNFSAWPVNISVRSGDTTLLMWPEWPAVVRMIVNTPSGTTGAANYVYYTASGLAVMAADLVNDPSDFGRAAAGEYQIRFGRPVDAAKKHILTYTLAGDTVTVISASAPDLPAGAVEVRRLSGYLIGRRYEVTHTALVSAFRISIEAQQLKPGSMTSAVNIPASDALTQAAIAPAAIPSPTGASTYQIVNARTGQATTVTGTLSVANPTIGGTVSLARQANDGMLLVQIKGKAAAAEVENGDLIIGG